MMIRQNQQYLLLKTPGW